VEFFLLKFRSNCNNPCILLQLTKEEVQKVNGVDGGDGANRIEQGRRFPMGPRLLSQSTSHLVVFLYQVLGSLCTSLFV